MNSIVTSGTSYYYDSFYYTNWFETGHPIPVYLSLYGYASDIKLFARNVSSKRFRFQEQYEFSPALHKFKTEYKDGIGHIVVWLRQIPIYRVNNRLVGHSGFFYLYSSKKKSEIEGLIDEPNNKLPSDIMNQLYNVIANYTGIPCLPQWIPYILRQSWKNATDTFDLMRYQFRQTDEEEIVHPIGYQLDQTKLKNIISNGLDSGAISIPECNGICSERLNNVTTLDDYLNNFSEELSNKVHSTFVPLFNPDKQEFDTPVKQFDIMTKYRKKINLLHDQQSVINAVCKRLDQAYSAIIVGNMGSGKSIMSIGSIYAHSKMHHKKYTNNIIMCPGHLVNKWKREIQDSYPLSEVIICNDFNQFVYEIEPILKDKNRHTNLFIVMSKDIAKGEFEEQPVVYSKMVYENNPRTYSFMCPSCGYHYNTNINTKDMEGPPDSFVRKTHKNACCPKCHEPLWAPSLGKKSRYVKIPNIGWIEKRIMDELYKYRYRDMDIRSVNTKKERQLMEAVVHYHDDKTLFAAPLSRKYSIARYIYRKYRNKFDYFVADECHQYSGTDSSQGKAFSLLVRSAKHTIGLTGTLMNGYASNLFYLMFRMFPKKMVNAGYSYTDSNRFMRKYGVVETKKTIRNKDGYHKKASQRTSERPGVSPVVFTDYLLNSCVFISLEYSAPYSEIPLGVEMDEDVRANYDDFCKNVKQLIDTEFRNSRTTTTFLNLLNSSSRGKMLMQAVNELTLYPDQPYDRDPIFDENTNKIVAQLEDIDDKKRLLPKEEETLDIIEQATNRGEHVLIYTYWTNKTNCQERLKKIISDHGYNVDILTNSVLAKKRESWIKDKVDNGLQVLICNPTLVETGLDLLDFTTIIFYQLGYKLTTMRQASRRSYRLNQKNPVHVYFLYYKDTAQEQALAIMALKLHAATALEGKFSSEGLAAVNADDTDILGQLAKSIADDDKFTVDKNAFQNTNVDSDDIKFVQNDDDEETYTLDVFDTRKYRKNNKRRIRNVSLTASAVSW